MKTKVEVSLFERVGGRAALEAAVNLFYKKVLADSEVNTFFEATDMKRQRTKLKSFLAMALGAPVKYTGKNLTDAHAQMVKKGLNEKHFFRVAGHLKETLQELNVAEDLIDEVMAIAGSTKNDVLGINLTDNKMKKNYYQEKGNGSSNSGGAPNNESVEELLDRIAELEKDKRRNEQALEQALDAVVTIDSRKIILFFNKTAEELFGFAKKEVLGKNVKMIVPIEHQSNHDNYVDSNIRTSINKVVGAARELEMTRKDGSRFWGNLSLSKCEVDGDIQYTAFIKDISEDRANRERITQTLEQAVDSVITIDSDRKVLFFNKSAEKMFGFSREEVLGQNVKMIVPMEHRGVHDTYVEANMKTGINKVVGAGRDLEMSRKDGAKFWGNLSLSKVVVGEDVQYTAFIKDITEERANRERMTQTLEQAVDSVITINSDRKILFFNKSAEKMFGFSREEVIGQNVKMIVPMEHRASHDNYVDANMKTGINKVVGAGRDLEMTRRDGSKFWGNLSLSKVVVGEDVQYTAFIKDISEERFLRERNTQTLEQAVDSVVTIDEAKNITYFNKSAEKMFGFKREEVLGKNVKMIVPIEHRGVHDEYVDANIRTGVNKVVGAGRDLEMTKKDGAKFWGNLSLSKVEVDGKIQYTAFIKDITTTKHNELGFTEVIKAIREIAKGSFEFDINLNGLRVDESVKQVSSDIMGLRDNVKRILDDVNDVVKKAGVDGELNARLQLSDTQGAWKELVDSINELLQSIAEPVLEFNKIITEMSNGDLTTEFRMASSGDIKNMADALNKAIRNINDLLYTIGKNADVVASSSMNMLQKTEGMKRNTTEVASAISQMAKGAQDQAQRTDESSKLVEQVMKSATEMESKANLINKAAEKGQMSSEDGLKIMKTLVSNMTGIKDSALQTSSSIEILTQRAEEIGRTLNVITDIASQTNLLALNAAIEAARAGDAGRGFAVVAEEIRKLAEDSRKSAVEIEKIIGDVQKDTQAASRAIETMQGSVKDGNVATNEAEKIFQEIAGSSEETFSVSKEIQNATAGQRASIDMVVKNIEQIVVVAEETAAGTQQVASSSQQLSNSMTEITDGSNKLSGVAAELQDGVNKFKLRRAS